MTRKSTPSTVLATLAAVGGALWLAKLAVIAATGGAVTDTGAAAVFYLAGAALLLIGSAAVGTRVAAGRHVALRIGALAASPVLFFVSYAALDGIAKTLVDHSGPPWLHDEAGIGLTAAVWLCAGLLLAMRRIEPVVGVAR